MKMYVSLLLGVLPKWKGHKVGLKNFFCDSLHSKLGGKTRTIKLKSTPEIGADFKKLPQPFER